MDFQIITIFGQTLSSETIGVLRQAMGLGVATIGPVVFVYIVIKASSGILGKIGAFVNNPNRGPVDALRKRAGGYREYRQNKRKGKALSGSHFLGAGRFKRLERRRLRDENAKSLADSGSAQFGITDAGARDYIQGRLRHDANANAAKAAQSTMFIQATANDNAAGSGMGDARGNKQVAEALAAQQTKAISEAIKDVQLSANFEPGDIASIAKEMREAIKANDSIGARAYQDMLLRSGSPGLSAYRETMKELENSSEEGAGNAYQGDLSNSLRNNIIENHAGLKGTSNDLMQQAIKGGSMSEHGKNEATWSGLSAAELVSQKPAAQKLAIASGAVDKGRAEAILSNAQLTKDLSSDIQASLEKIAGATAQSLQNPSQQAPTTPTDRPPTTGDSSS